MDSVVTGELRKMLVFSEISQRFILTTLSLYT